MEVDSQSRGKSGWVQRVDKFTEKYKLSQTGSYKINWDSQRKRGEKKECVETSQESKGNKLGVKVLDIKESRIQEKQDGNTVMFRLNNQKRYFVQKGRGKNQKQENAKCSQ